MLTNTAYEKESKKINTMRSDLIRLIDPKEGDESQRGIGNLRDSTSHAKLKSRTKMAEIFLDLTGDLVPGRSTSEVHQEVSEIMHTAAQFSTKINTQRNRVRCDGLSNLPPTFKHESNMMQAYCLHSEALRDNPRAMDGKRTLLVVQSAFVLVGKADGSDYSQEVVLKKAFVWMG